MNAQTQAHGGETPSPARPDRRAARRQETKNQIVAAAWDLVREQGLAGLAMRDLGDRVGMRAQSIYSYFESKHEIYDVMFHEGYLAFTNAFTDAPDTMGATGETASNRQETARRVAHQFFEFCTSDPVRYQLLFQRTIPGFVPSEQSYAVALAAYEVVTTTLATLGITEPEAVDAWTALLTGLTDQQISNDPEGDRWERLVDRSVDMYLREFASPPDDPTRARKQQ